MIQNRKQNACATRFSLPANRFHTETGGHFAFTWFRCEIMKFSPRYNNGVNSRHEREPEWSRAGTKVAQVSCKHPLRKFGFLCIQEISALTKSYVRRYVRRSTPSCKPGWNFLLQATARFGGKLHDYQNFPKQKNSNKAESLRLKFNAYIDVDNKESARAREKKMTETNFVGKKTCNCYGGGENKKCYRPPGWK